MRNHISFRSAILPFSVAAALSLTACGAEDIESAAGSSTPAAASSESGAEQAGEAQVTLDGGWVKATDEEMTSIFGTLTNPGEADVELESAEVDVDADVELHEVVQEAGSSVMQQVDGTLPIPAGGELSLEPGGYHLMLVNLGEEIAPGQDVELTLHFADGTETTTTIAARAFEGAQEEYHAGGSDANPDEGDSAGSDAGAHEGMDHSQMDHGDTEGHDH